MIKLYKSRSHYLILTAYLKTPRIKYKNYWMYCYPWIFHIRKRAHALVARTYNPLVLTFCLHIYFQSNFFIISSLFHQFNLFVSIFINLMLTATYMCRLYKSRKSRKIVKRDNLTNVGSRNRKSKLCFISPMFEWYEVYIINVWAKCCEQKVCMIIENLTSSQRYRRRRLRKRFSF
jgi:hypothetical protein